MGRSLLTPTIALAFGAILVARESPAQVSLADDIIAAATAGKENARQKERSSLGRKPGSSDSPYRRSPGSTDVVLGGEPTRHVAPLPRLTRRLSDPTGLDLPEPERGLREHGLAPSIERLPRAVADSPPLVDGLIGLALAHRPDLLALRRGVERARAEVSNERAERFSDAYLLYTPFEYRDHSQSGQLSVSTWGAGLFVSAPLFNRNQGNLRRAGLNVDQSRNELAAVERSVIAEVDQAVRDFANTREDVLRLEGATLPAIRRKRDRARDRLRSGEIDPAAFLAIQRDSTSLVRYHRETLARHRRNALKINTAVGHRVMP